MKFHSLSYAYPYTQPQGKNFLFPAIFFDPRSQVDNNKINIGSTKSTVNFINSHNLGINLGSRIKIRSCLFVKHCSAMNFSRLYSRLSALVGRPKANPKLPSSINIALRLYGTTRTTGSDGGDYAILAPIKHGQPKPGVENGPYILKQFLPAKVRTIDP